MAQTRVPDAGGPSATAGRFAHLRWRLRWKLLIAYVTPLILISVYFHFQYHATIREGIDNHLQSIAENQRNTVDLFLQERVANVKNSFAAVEPTGEPDGMESVLLGLRRKSYTFVDVGLFAPDGHLVSYAGEFDYLKGKDYSQESWFRDLLSSERDHLISDVYLGFRRRPHFVLAIRRDVDGRPWVLRASVDPVRFGEFVSSTHLAEEAEAFIVNANGVRQTAGSGAPSESPCPVPAEPRDEATVFDLEEGGTEYLCARAWLSEIDWALVVRIPADRALAPLRRARLIITGIMLLTLLLVVILVLRNTATLVSQLEKADETKADLQRQLHTAGKLASVGEMAAGVAHEINNPLAVIHEEAGMMLDLLDLGRDIPVEELRDRLRAITEATMRGRGITRKLLAFARQGDPSPKPTNVRELIDRVLEMRENEFKVGNIDVVREYGEGVPTLQVNPNELEQVLLNLLNNARDAISGSGRVLVRTECRDGAVRIAVTDDGCGMTGEQMEKIFFPFYTTKDVGRGTGLGLSISYGIIETMGGRIDVQSRPGQGSTFTIVLPVTGRLPDAETKDRHDRAE